MRWRGAFLLFGLVMAACAAAPVPTIPGELTGPMLTGDPQSVADENGTFRLVINADQDRYRAGQLIQVGATLAYVGPDPEITASGSGTLVGFGIKMQDSQIHTEPLSTADCVRYVLTRGSQVAYPFVKSGTGASPGDPLAPFYESYFSSTDLRLAAGTWTISAETSLYAGDQCRGAPTHLSTSLSIVVEP